MSKASSVDMLVINVFEKELQHLDVVRICDEIPTEEYSVVRSYILSRLKELKDS